LSIDTVLGGHGRQDRPSGEKVPGRQEEQDRVPAFQLEEKPALQLQAAEPATEKVLAGQAVQFVESLRALKVLAGQGVHVCSWVVELTAVNSPAPHKHLVDPGAA